MQLIECGVVYSDKYLRFGIEFWRSTIYYFFSELEKLEYKQYKHEVMGTIAKFAGVKTEIFKMALEVESAE